MEEIKPESPALLVSVVVVSHNSAGALRRCLAALETSTGREQIEIVAVDNGSSDGCRNMDSEFPNISILRLPHHCGLTKARNIGIRTARADILLLLSPWVEVEPATVLALQARLEQDSSALAVCPSLTGPAGELRTRAHLTPDAASVAACWENPAALPPAEPGDAVEVHDGMAICLRKRTVQGINYLDEKYGEHWIDVDLARQIRGAGKKILLASDIRARLNIEDPVYRPVTASDRAAFTADAAAGAARYLGKYFGFGAALGFRIKLALATLLKVVTFQDPGYNASLLSRLLNGYKIDGKSEQL